MWAAATPFETPLAGVPDILSLNLGCLTVQLSGGIGNATANTGLEEMAMAYSRSRMLCAAVRLGHVRTANASSRIFFLDPGASGSKAAFFAASCTNGMGISRQLRRDSDPGLRLVGQFLQPFGMRDLCFVIRGEVDGGPFAPGVGDGQHFAGKCVASLAHLRAADRTFKIGCVHTDSLRRCAAISSRWKYPQRYQDSRNCPASRFALPGSKAAMTITALFAK